MDKREQMTFTGGNPQEEPPRRVAKKSKKRFLWLALVTLLALLPLLPAARMEKARTGAAAQP